MKANETLNLDDLKDIEKTPFDSVGDFFIGFIDNEILLISTITMGILFIIFTTKMIRSYAKATQSIKSITTYMNELELKCPGNNQNNKTPTTNEECFKVVAQNIGNNKNLTLSHELNILKLNFIYFDSKTAPMLPSGLTHELFNTNTIEESQTSPGILNRGNLFITLGVFGTFLGLTIGVSQASDGLASTDIMLARQAMGDLLGGAELAFTTSLLGLVMTVVYNEILGLYRKRLGQECRYLISNLNSKFLPGNTALISAMQTKSLSTDITNLNTSISQCNKNLLNLHRLIDNNNAITSDGFKSTLDKSNEMISVLRNPNFFK